MGVRPNKVIGYGLTNLKVKDYKVIDSRINKEGIIFNWEKYEQESITQYLQNIKCDVEDNLDQYLNYSMVKHALNENPDLEPADCIICNTEYGLDNILVIVPPGHADKWVRHDNTLDWYQETYPYNNAFESQKNRVQTLNNGIFPYSEMYMDKRTNHEFSSREEMDSIILIIRLITYSQSTLKEESPALSKLVNKLGFNNLEEYQENVVPIIPDCVQTFCEYYKIFNDPETVYELRPMIYTYWA